jgi:hypothetical protein
MTMGVPEVEHDVDVGWIFFMFAREVKALEAAAGQGLYIIPT